MIVTLNGQSRELPPGATVADAVRAAGVDGGTRGVAVAVDGEVVRRGEWDERRLDERQAVEVVRAAQGG